MQQFDLSLIICLIGGIVYLFLDSTGHYTKARSVRLAEIMFAIGLFCYLFGGK